jgi:hypothetical protein
MKSEFKKLHRDVLLEWIYDPTNVILEPFKIMRNSKDFINSYIATDSTVTNNSIYNQLFTVDASTNKYTVVDTSKFSFLNISEYVSPIAIRHDRLKIYFPSNYTFGEYQGIYLRLYTYDFRNKKFCEISNYFYDATDTTRNDLNKRTSPLLYQDQVWDRYIELNVPSVFDVSLQRQGGVPISGSINQLLTDNQGLSQTAPIFIDFKFINKIVQVGNVKNYLLSQKITQQVPQIPKLEALGLYIEESNSGDYFEIYATYNKSFEEFVSFIDSSKLIGNYYYLEFLITLFEENIKGKSLTYKIENDFTEIVEFRPIIKYSTTTSIIDVEMKLINKSDGNIVVRKGAYGMKPDQLSKYLVNRKKINIRGAFKPKIYSKNQYSLYKLDELGKFENPENELEIPVPELISLNDYFGKGGRKDVPNINAQSGISGLDGVGGSEISKKVISCFSNQALNRKEAKKIDNYHYMGILKIGIKPFDNLFKFILAYKFSNSSQLEPLDLTNCEIVKLIFRSDDVSIEFPEYFSDETSAKYGMCQFLVNDNKFQDLKKLYANGNVFFYITGINQGIRTVIYSGTFTILDTASNLAGQTIDDILNNTNTSDLLNSGSIRPKDGAGNKGLPTIIDPPKEQEIAIVTRKKVPINNNSSNSNANNSNSSNNSNNSSGFNKK